jgi:peptidoglycan/LPS O-acetylase OafA/YrhL
VEVASAINGFKAAFLYVANWFFIRRSSDYFATDVERNPVLHFWSLAVEEQFYLVWPVLLAGLFVLTRRLQAHAHRAMQIAVLAGAFASLFWGLHLSQVNLSRAYYGTDARAYQLLAGAFLALAPGLVVRASRIRGASVAAAAALLATLALATSLFDLSVMNRGIAVTLTTMVLIVAIESARRGPVNALLTSPSATYLGRISYGTYLWHWPVILVTAALIDISPTSMFFVAAFIATGLASLSYSLLERPVREMPYLDRVSPAVIVAGLALSVLGALVIIPHVANPDHAVGNTADVAKAASTQGGGTPVPAFDFAKVPTDLGELKGLAFRENCLGEPTERCTVVKGTGLKILVIGDSHARMWAPTFAKIARTQHLTLAIATSAGCPWQRYVYLANSDVALRQVDNAKCEAAKEDYYERVIPALKPDLVVAVSIDHLTDSAVRNADNEEMAADDAAQVDSQVKEETARSLAELQRSAKKVLIVEPVPVADDDHDPFICLTKSDALESCRFVSEPGPTPLEGIYRSEADNKRVIDMDFDRLVCPFLPICDPVIDGRIVRRDTDHLTPAYAISLADDVTEILQRDGVLPT